MSDKQNLLCCQALLRDSSLPLREQIYSVVVPHEPTQVAVQAPHSLKRSPKPVRRRHPRFQFQKSVDLLLNLLQRSQQRTSHQNIQLTQAPSHEGECPLLLSIPTRKGIIRPYEMVAVMAYTRAPHTVHSLSVSHDWLLRYKL
jgi:hypothetical protein